MLAATNKFYLLALIVLLPGCAKQKPAPAAPPASPNQAAPLVKVEEVASFTDAMQVVATTSLDCEDGSCPLQVGLFLAADKAGGFSPGSDSVAACTAVLVGEDLALTNSHCIPSAVKLLPDLCAERVRIVLPESAGYPEESLACAALLGHSERATNVSPDLALIRLERKSARPAALLRRDGMANGARLRSVKVNPDLKNLRGSVKSETCVSVASSYRMPIYTGPSSPALVLGDCTALPGNSGSPFFDSDGRVAGLMQAALPISENSRREWGEHLESKETPIAPLALGTSLLCLGAEPPAWSWNPACATVTEEDVARARPRIRQLLGSEGLEESTRAILAPYHAQTRLLRLERNVLETRPLRRKEGLVPACLAPAALWTADFSAPNGAPLPESAEIELELPFFSLELRFNRFLQPLPAVALITGSTRAKYAFSPRRAAEEGALQLSPADNGEPITLPACP